MATLVLTAVGTAFGGPIGGMIGAAIGQRIDSAVFAPKGRQGPRLGDLAVQTSSYGTPISKIFGSMRIGGTVVWATDLKEDRHRQGGGKGRPKTTTYSYSASFAVALSGREIVRVGRIWADGKLLRGAAGDFKTETGFRLYRGGEAQGVDPLIAAAEGRGGTPAFRGIAYAVFEDFQLGDYGNRIPSLTFEVVADEGGTSTGAIVGSIAGGAVTTSAHIASGSHALSGFAAHGDSIRAVIATLGEAMPEPIYDDGTTLRMGVSDVAVAMIEARLPGGTRSRLAAGQVPDAVSIGYHDPARDYQAGLQRASLGGPGRIEERIALAAAIDASAAKAIAAARLDTHWRTRERRGVTLPWRDMGLKPGRLVRFRESGSVSERVWQVVGWTLERMAVKLELVAHARGGTPAFPAGGGRSVASDDFVHGATTLHMFDAPHLGDGAARGARLLVAAAGASAGWRVAVLEASLDGGAIWSPAGATAPAATIGVASGVLGPAGSTLFDRRNSVEVTLLNDAMWLESRDDDALVAGANLAMLGDELIQFGDVDPLSAGRFRLSRLLRGRRGSEWAADGHVAGEAFVLIEADTLISVPVPDAAIGALAEVAARGVGDGAAAAIASAVGGIEAVRPLAPAHLRAQRFGDGSIDVRWTRRSRAGWSWIDGVDAPVGEAVEQYRITATSGGRERVVEVGSTHWIYHAETQAEDGAGPGLAIEVVQVGLLGASRPARVVVG